jgi:hypothetical protein
MMLAKLRLQAVCIALVVSLIHRMWLICGNVILSPYIIVLMIMHLLNRVWCTEGCAIIVSAADVIRVIKMQVKGESVGPDGIAMEAYLHGTTYLYMNT